jgi:hypothetical protein
MRLRTVIATGALLLAAPVLFANNPSGRSDTKLVYDPVSTLDILYGGSTALDPGTKVPYDLGDTWEWNGDRWRQRITVHSPGPRSAHALVYDSNRSRILLFGGRFTTPTTALQTNYNDTWFFKNGDWTKIDTPNAPPVRAAAGAAFDPIRDRMIVYGGFQISTDGKQTLIPLHDTWEFDGTTWVQRPGEGPKISKPILTYDAAHNQVILLGLDEASATKTDTLMYIYNSAAGTWTQTKPDGLPVCVNQAMTAFDESRNKVILSGGVCATSTSGDETYEWDGTKWTKLTVTTTLDRSFGGSMTFDQTRQMLVQYGGTIAFGSVRNWIIRFKDGDWKALTADTTSPTPRSLMAFWSEPHNGQLYMFGGRDEITDFQDFWSLGNSTWGFVTVPKTPALCGSPRGDYDTDRKVMVVVCDSSVVLEFDGTQWNEKATDTSKSRPPIRRFSSVAYDKTLKKTVLFGGFDETQYLNETWTWDGTTWTRVKKNPPQIRSQAAMWYDATLKKTVLYGGIGRNDTLSRIVRFSDMWSFDGSGWTEMKNVTTPGQRYSATFAVDPRDGHLLLFGGLLYELNGTVEKQTYLNDMWEWDGAKWTKLTTTNTPTPRENSGFTYDPVTDRMVLFGGFRANYFGDFWSFDKKSGAWQQQLAVTTGTRRRPAIRLPPGAGGGNVTAQSDDE